MPALLARLWPKRRLLAAELIQTSAMDCGPVALASILQSHGLPADPGRLREACQTDLDGTSIDVIEQVLTRMGLPAQQEMLPPDRVAAALPALAVVRLPDGAPHFVVLWRRVGPLVQVMDPARGRYWARTGPLLARLMQHRMAVPAQAWRAWAGEEENLAPLRAGLHALGLPPLALKAACAAPGWFPLAATEACLRLVRALVQDGALPRHRAGPLFTGALQATLAAEDDIFRLVPPEFWPVTPDPTLRRGEEPRLILSGAVLLRLMPPGHADQPLMPDAPAPSAPRPISRPASRPGLIRPLLARVRAAARGQAPVLLAGTALAVLGSLAEAVVFRGLIAPMPLSLPGIPWILAGLLALYGLRLGLGAAVLALGRRVEDALRRDTGARLLRLPDRWLASRPLADLAERVQSLHLTRNLPGALLHLVQAATEVLALAAGLVWLMPGQAGWILALAGAALAWPLATGPLLRDAALTQRSLAAAAGGVVMDALRGQAPVQAHGAAPTLIARHEALLADATSAAAALSWRSGALGALGQALVLGLIAVILNGPGPVDLLILWWALKLAAAAGDLGQVLRQIPAQAAILARIEEPLSAPLPPPARLPAALARAPGLALRLDGVSVLAAGHPVLTDLTLDIAAGEHVAVVGTSGSGKSSLIGVLMGWHRPQAGQVLVGGQVMHEPDLVALRGRVAWIDPTGHIWPGTLRGSLPARSDADRRAALARARLDLPGGLDRPTGAGGALLSAGEGQRLRLARGLLRQDAALILCDEALRGLDRAQRAPLLDEVRRAWPGATLIWVTHDIGEALRFPRVLVMSGGTCAEDGAPQDLLARGGRLAALHAAEAGWQAALRGPGWQEWAISGRGGHVQPAT